jgi:hypothetical protein
LAKSEKRVIILENPEGSKFGGNPCEKNRSGRDISGYDPSIPRNGRWRAHASGAALTKFTAL